MTAIRTDRYKLIESSIDTSTMLFDLLADPGETINLERREPDLIREVRAIGPNGSRPASVAVVPTVMIDTAMRERLRALGYTEWTARPAIPVVAAFPTKPSPRMARITRMLSRDPH